MREPGELNYLSFGGDGSPIVIAFVGPNGSGKSSIVRQLGFVNAHPGDRRYRGHIATIDNTNEIIVPLVNADEIAKRIGKRNPEWSKDQCNKAAFYEAQETRQIFSDARIDFAFETVGSHPSKVEFLENLKARGYMVWVLFVSTESPEINIKRVHQRYLAGGHDVPEFKIVSRYRKTMRLLPSYFNVADHMVVYDNSNDCPPQIGHGPRLLLTKGPSGVSCTKAGRHSKWLAKWLGEAIG